MGLTISAHGLVHLYEGVLPPLIPLLIGVFGTDYFHLGIVATLFSYAFGLGSIPAGYFSDKIGPRRLITWFLFGSGILSVLVLPLSSLWAYGVIMGFIGLFCSFYHPASNTLISLTIREKGNAFGIHGIAGSLGVAIVPVLSAWMGSLLSWQSPHVLFGLFGIAVGVFSLSLPRLPEDIRMPASPEEKEMPAMEIPYVKLVAFFGAATFLGLTYKGIMTFLPAYMGENVHLDFLKMDTVRLGGTVATLALLSGAVGQYLAGRLSDLYKPEKLYWWTVVMGTFSVFAMAYMGNILLVVSAVFYAFFYFAVQPIQNYILTIYLPKRRHGLGFGLHFFLTFGVGSTAAAVCGYLADHFGLKSVFYAMGICFVISSFLAYFLLIKAKRKD
jgi:MFS family permease